MSLGIALAGGGTASANPITSAGTITAGNLQFSDFGCSISNSGNAGPDACSNINVDTYYGSIGGVTPGLRFSSGFNAYAEGIWPASSNEDALLTYTVKALNGTAINKLALDFNGEAEKTWFGRAIAAVTETVVSNGRIVGKLTVSCTTAGSCDMQDPSFESSDIPLDGLYTDLFVTKDIQLAAYSNKFGSAFATISYVDQNFGVVPEPASVALLGMGLLGLGYVSRRKTAA